MKINLKTLQESINHDATVIYEALNTDEAKKLYSLVIDLYEEVNAFQKEAPVAALNALSPQLQQIHDMLENMLKEPMNYVSNAADEDSEIEGTEEMEMELEPSEEPTEEPTEEPEEIETKG